MRLMIPGPVDVANDVMQLMSFPQVPHYSKEAVVLYENCISNLRHILSIDDNGYLLIMAGSGSLSIETAINAVARDNEKIVVCVNGIFGERMKTISHSYGAKIVELKVEEGKAIKEKLVRRILEDNPDAKALLMVHTETSTGVCNPISRIGEVAYEYDIPFVVDAVSSLGVEKFSMEKFHVDFCCFGSQKGLENPPGLGILGVSRRAINRFQSQSKNYGWYANLYYWLEAAEKKKLRKDVAYPSIVTMPVNNIRALEKSLQNIADEGIEERIKRHKKIASIVRNGIKKLGFALFAEKGYESSTVTAVCNNLNIDVQELIAFLIEKYHLQISNGLGGMFNKIFRIGHIGQSASLDYVVTVLFGIEHYLRFKGFKLPIGLSLSDIDTSDMKIEDR